MKISVIVPFYKGNEYMARLFESIERVSKEHSGMAEWEIILVNDSPDETIVIPDTELSVNVLVNPCNLGIHGTRIHGLTKAVGDWILFLDQDDELISEGFQTQLEAAKSADVVVGNGIYKLGKYNRAVFPNLKVMEYLIREQCFIEIRNLIPSPGECLIKREKISELWKKNQMHHNGADDWFLWLLLFKEKAIFSCNENMVYIHNDTGGTNLSANYDKMRESSEEMVEILRENLILNERELKKLSNAIAFKYYQDTHQLTLGRMFRYADSILDNVQYRLKVNTLKRKDS